MLSRVMTPVQIDQQDVELIERLVSAIHGLSDREAAEAVGLSHTQITRYRGPMDDWPRPTAKTRRKIGEYLARSATAISVRDDALRVIEELQKKLDELRDDLAG
jgi:transcriptional regulator with XRE-family HTH domain